MEKFVRDLLAETGISDDMDEEAFEQLVRDLTSRADKLVNRRLIEALPEEAVPGLEQLLEDEATQPEQLQQYVAEHVEDVRQVTADALLEFRNLYLGDE